MALYDIAANLRPLDLGQTLGRIDQMQASRLQQLAFQSQIDQQRADNEQAQRLSAALPGLVPQLTSNDPAVRNSAIASIAGFGQRGLSLAQPFISEQVRQAGAPPPRTTREVGSQTITEEWDPVTRTYRQIGTAPRWQPQQGPRQQLVADGQGGFVLFNPVTGQIQPQPRQPSPFERLLLQPGGQAEQPAAPAPSGEPAPAEAPAAPPMASAPANPDATPVAQPGAPAAEQPGAPARPVNPNVRLPSPELWERAVIAAAAGDPFAARFVQIWKDFMRQREGVTVNNNMPPQESALLRVDAKTLERMDEGATQARAIIAMMDQAERAVRAVPQGAGAQLVPILGQIGARFGFEIPGSSEAEVLQGITNTLATLQRVPGSGATTDFEMRLYMQAVPRLGNTREGNLQLIEMGRALAKRKIDEARIYRQHAGKPDLQERIDALGPVLTDTQRAFLEQGIAGRPGIITEPGAGPGPGGQGTATPPPARPAPPRVGEVREGWRFNGGDPASPQSWSRVQ